MQERIATVSLGAVLALLLALTATSHRLPSGEDPSDSGTSISGILRHNYRTLAELTRDADVIARGRVTRTQASVIGGLPFMTITLEILDPVRGLAQRGQRIALTNTGGVLPRSVVKDGSTGRPHGRVIEASFEGVPVMRHGEEFLVFLRRDSNDIPYTVLGEYQGRFLVDSSGTIRYTGDPAALARPEFDVLRQVNGRSVTEVIVDVRSFAR